MGGGEGKPGRGERKHERRARAANQCASGRGAAMKAGGHSPDALQGGLGIRGSVGHVTPDGANRLFMASACSTDGAPAGGYSDRG